MHSVGIEISRAQKTLEESTSLSKSSTALNIPCDTSTQLLSSHNKGFSMAQKERQQD